jgi:hypothetical protein
MLDLYGQSPRITDPAPSTSSSQARRTSLEVPSGLKINVKFAEQEQDVNGREDERSRPKRPKKK